MRLTLEKIKIENFKGIRKLEIDFGTTETAITARNGCGKSSIADAFTWVLFNKDSHGNAPGSDDFREKPLDENGAEMHNLDTMVELECKLDGQRFCLKRVQKENWVKRRGSTNPEFKGNVSAYWINDVETKLADFKARIAEIVPEDIFRLIGTLAAFNTQDWKKRREQLLALTGGEVDSKLLSTDEYRPLADECGQRNIGIDELRKVLTDQRRRINTELNAYPIRIDEARKALPTFGKDEIDTAEYVIGENARDIAHLDELIAAAKAGANRATHGAEIARLEQEAASLTRQITNEWTTGQRELYQRRDEASEAVRKAAEQKTSDENRLGILNRHLANITEEVENLRNSYKSAYSEQFVWADGTRKCPTCGQEIPEAMVAQKKAEAMETFKRTKAEKLESLKKNGITKAEEQKQAAADIAALNDEIAKTEARLAEAMKARDAVAEEIKAYPTAPAYDDPQVETLRKKIAELREEDARVTPESTDGYESRKAFLMKQTAEKQAILARRDAGLETEKRIEELEAEQKETGNRMAEVEQLIALTEKFITDRCSALEESINAKFQSVRWKLFNIQINGGIDDACEAMVNCDGRYVPYSTANTAAQIHADIEIVDVLSKAYDVRIPLFVDNAERCNYIPKTDSQMITMSVSKDEQITVTEVA